MNQNRLNMRQRIKKKMKNTAHLKIDERLKKKVSQKDTPTQEDFEKKDWSVNMGKPKEELKKDMDWKRATTGKLVSQSETVDDPGFEKKLMAFNDKLEKERASADYMPFPFNYFMAQMKKFDEKLDRIMDALSDRGGE